jgi:3-oxoacyl-[acyl-carrier protein] reductase
MQRVAVVTGSSSGIGRATARRLADEGMAVVLHARTSCSELQRVASELQGLGVRTLCVLADITVPHARQAFVQAAFAWQGRVDVWVNNAGADILTTEAQGWDFDAKLELLLATDVQGTMLLSREVSRRMLTQAAQGLLPTIINIGWDQAWLGMEGESGQLFCATKAAVMAFTNSLAMTVAPDVRVNCVAPGWIKTAWGTSSDSYWDRRAKAEALLGRWGAAEDVAQTISWLVSPAAEFVNGQCIAVNGGRRFTAER